MLHILVGSNCNNNCIFCMESDRRGRAEHILGQGTADLFSMLESYPVKDEVLFTSGEPTLNTELPGLIEHAKSKGFRRIGLITNGRMLAYGEYTRDLVKRGLNKVTLSIHGHQAKLHDGLVRVKGAFEQTLQGLKQLSSRTMRPLVEIHTSTVVVKRNLPHVREIHALLSSLGVDRMCFNTLMLKGRGREHQGILMAQYSAIAKEFELLAQSLDQEQARRISLADIPRCLVSDLGFELIGDQESFEQFEFLGSNGIAHISAEDLESLKNEAPDRSEHIANLQKLVEGTAQLSGDDDYYLTSREVKDNILRVKRAECQACVFNERCPGVWESYVAEFGWDEFRPHTKAR